jgi:NAD(P)-dependent dehydrogenase (short-subunit alcohol dehydrogenase family)
VLVTGAAAGIGGVVARAFAGSGASVVVADVDAAAGARTVAAIEASGGSAVFVETDVRRDGDARRAVATAVERHGALDAAVNNAGIAGAREPVAAYPEQAWDDVIATNLTGVFLCLRAELEVMLGQGAGAVVNVASIYGLVAAPGLAAYAASKAGVIGLTRTAATEVAAAGVRVNAVAPGLIATGLTDASPADFVERLTAEHPIGRMGTPAEVAAAVLWLCSDAASFVVGHTLAVDGGMTVH